MHRIALFINHNRLAFFRGVVSCRSDSCPASFAPTTTAAAGQAGDDGVKDGDDTVDDGFQDSAHGVDDGHQEGADGVEHRCDLEDMSISIMQRE